jgi:hypothetical protein
MRGRFVRACVVLACLLVPGSLARAEAAPDPLKLIPEEAELILQVHRPGQLAEMIYNLDIVQDALSIDAVREVYQSTKARRALQLLAYFEKALGHQRFDLLDKLAGGGITLAAKLTGPSPVVLGVVQSREEATLKKFTALALDVVEHELARQESKERIARRSYRGIETIQIGQGHLAVAGSALLVANHPRAIERAVDCYLERGAKSIAGSPLLAEGRRLLPTEPLGFFWMNLARVREIPGVKDAFKTIRLDNNLKFLIGPIFEVARRSPLVCAGLYKKDDGFLTTVRMARGREGMDEIASLVLPADNQGTLPLIEPPNVQASISFFLDLGKLWNEKEKLFGGKKGDKALANLEKNSGRFLGGVKLGTLLDQMGPHHRIVLAQQKKTGYNSASRIPIPGFAWVIDMRDPAFARNMETILRGVGLLATFNFPIKLVEEGEGTSKIVGYRFVENKPLKGDDNNVRFNFSPCFTTAGKSFVISSTLELGHMLAQQLVKEKDVKLNPATTRFQIYASGFAAGLEATKEQIRTSIILGQALNPKDAQGQVRDIVRAVQRLGVLQFEIEYGKNDFRYDIRWKWTSKLRSGT